MAWVKLDDDFFGNPKIIRAGKDARDLYLAGLCFCNRGLTDGFIPIEALRRLGADADVDDPRELADRLVDVGLWDRANDGFGIHDYLDYQPSKERVLATRGVRAEAGSKGGKQKASNLPEVSQTFASENLKQNPTPSRTRPVPVLDPEPDPAKADDARAPARVVAVPSDQDSIDTPYGMWSAFCAAADYDIGAATAQEKGRSLKAAQRLIAGEVTTRDVADCTRYLRSQHWRTGVLSLSVVEAEVGKWRMAGKPAAERARASPGSARPSSAEGWDEALAMVEGNARHTTAIETTWRAKP